MTVADTAAVQDSWRLADGTPFPVPITLDVPAGFQPADAVPDRILLADPEGTPLAVMTIERADRAAQSERRARWSPGAAGRSGIREPAARARAVPPADAEPRRGARRARRRACPRASLPGRPLTSRKIGQVRHLAGQLKARVLDPAAGQRSHSRGRLAAGPDQGRACGDVEPAAGSLVVPVPLPQHPAAPAAPRRDLARWP